nr:hypothetical protein [Tanacetum cinerariifolium]
MIRSSTRDLFSPLENPKQKFRSKRRLFKTPSLVESKFDQISDIEEQSEEEVKMTEIMKQYMRKIRGDYGSGVTRPKIYENSYFQVVFANSMIKAFVYMFESLSWNGQKKFLATTHYGEICKDKAKRRNSEAKTKIFKENSYLLPYAVSSKEDTMYQHQLITSIRVRSILDSAYHSSPIRRMPSWSSVKDMQLI